MLSLQIKNPELEKEFLEILRYRYEGNTEKVIEDFILFLEEIEDEVDIERRRDEPLISEEDMMEKLKNSGWFDV
jgi:hypothetical protein